MNKVMFGIMATLLVTVAGVGFVQAFELVELYPFVTYVDPDFGNSLQMFHTHWIPDISQPEIKFDSITVRTNFPGTESTTDLVFHDDGRVTLNGKGICLDDGTSTNGGTCPGTLSATPFPLP